MVKRFAQFLIVGLAFLCGPTLLRAKSATHNISIEQMKFAKPEQNVVLGDVIVWENKDLVPHTVTAEDGSFDSKTIEPGKRWTFRPRKIGSTNYKCSFHPTMAAVLIVN